MLMLALARIRTFLAKADASSDRRGTRVPLESAIVLQVTGASRSYYSIGALTEAHHRLEEPLTIPAAWMPAAKMSRIHIHWTAGGYSANDTDRKSYHILVEGDGNVVRGVPSIALNEKAVKGSGYAAHTLNANSGAIGVSLCCMGGKGVRESPLVAGSFPLKRSQWDKMVAVVAILARRYDIPVTSKTILTHAEVEANLGIKQKGKWDITCLPYDASLVGARAIGDRLRHDVAVALQKEAPQSETDIAEEMKPPMFRVTAVAPATLTFRNAPSGAKKGALVEGTPVEKLNESGGWWQVRTPAGFIGWVWSEFLQPA